MSAIPYDSQTHATDTPQQEGFAPPGRPRRRFFNRKSATLAALLTCAAGFYAGVTVEKGQVASPAATTTAALPFGSTGGATAAGAAGARSGFAAGARGGGNASFGTVSSVDGNTIYLTGSSGNTVKVTLSSATTVTKSETVSATSVRPGDAVVVQGLKSSNGAITATSVTDTGTGGAPTTGSALGGAHSTTTGTAG